MSAILRVRDEDGNIAEIPAIRGRSAYEYAKDGGFTGSEAEFAEKLAAEYLKPTDVVDNLLSDSSELPLSAKQGGVLDGKYNELSSKIFDTDWHSGSCTLTLEKGKIMSVTLTDGSTYTFVRYSSGGITWIPIFVNSITACTISTNDSDGTIIITNTNGDNVRAVGIRY